jgi:hypothetical protein
MRMMLFSRSPELSPLFVVIMRVKMDINSTTQDKHIYENGRVDFDIE